jgi:hypothetical protein
MDKYVSFSIPMETVGNLVYLGMIALAIGAFYLFCIAMDSIQALINKRCKRNG